MNVEIFTDELRFDLYGYSGTALNRDYVPTLFKLMDRVWQSVKSNGIRHKGKNIWVYEADHKVFAGVELEDSVNGENGLEHKMVVLSHYAYYKHVGAYSLIKESGAAMTRILKERGFETRLPYVEKYGHWTGDENSAETELFMSLVRN